MQTYRQQVHSLLEKFVGKTNVLEQEYRQMTLETRKEDLKTDKVRGSTRMQNRNVKTEKEFDIYFSSVIDKPLP